MTKKEALTPIEAEVSELADLEAQLEAKRLAREVKLKEREARDHVAWMKLELRDADALEKAEEEHGELGVKLAQIKTPMGSVLLKKPRTPDYLKFTKSKMEHENVVRLVHECLAYPDNATFKVLNDEYPALYTTCANEIAKLAGIGMSQEVLPK